MGSHLSIAKNLDVKDIYEYCFLYNCESRALKLVNVAELELLHRQWENMESIASACDDNIILSRVMPILFSIEEGSLYSQITFETFLKVFYYWKVTPVHDKLEQIFKILDVNNDGQISASDVAYFYRRKDVKVGDKDGRLGTLRWIGVLKGKKDTYYGIELDIDSGKNNGSYLGKTYFKCDEGKGVFITPQAVESESNLISASRALSEFSKKAAGEAISLETFKSICIRESWVTDLFSQDIMPKELSNIKLIS